MAKDPAFLFYSGDFLVGTALFTDAEIGQYMKLLCFMHQSGHISKEDMFNICPNISFKVLAKFKQDEAGLYFNERLEKEIEKRKAYSDSRRKNRLKKDINNISKSHEHTYDVAMSTHMENVNENRNVNELKERVQGEKQIDNLLNSSLDELYIDNLRTVYPLLNLKYELLLFKAKVRGSPGEYENRDTDGIRLAFQYQLRNTKPEKKNEQSKGSSRTTSAIIGAKDYSTPV